MLSGVVELEHKLMFAQANLELLFNSEVFTCACLAMNLCHGEQIYLISNMQLNIKIINALHTLTRYRNLF